MKKLNQIIIIGAVAILAVVFLVSARNLSAGGISFAAQDKQSQQQDPSLQVQDIKTIDGVENMKLSYVNYQYKLDPPVMKKGVPVRIEVDLNTVTGCMQSVTIPAFGVRKYVSSGDNIIEFTPDRSGKFDIVCSMGMGRQTFSVLDENGAASPLNTQAAPSASSPSSQGGACGAGGGCGCGARL